MILKFKHKNKKIKNLLSCNKTINFLIKNNNLLFINLQYYNKLDFFKFVIFLQNNNYFSCNLQKINTKSLNIIKNTYFFKNTNYVLSFSNEQQITKDFINIFNNYQNENIDFMYFKFKEFNSLISLNYFVEFFKFKNKKIISVKLLKVLYFTNLYFIKVTKNKNK